VRLSEEAKDSKPGDAPTDGKEEDDGDDDEFDDDDK